MPDWFEIMRKLNQYRLRKHDGHYTLEFQEGRHRFQLHRHDTGQHLRIWVVDDAGDTLLVYDKTEWFSSRYEFNGTGPGWVHRGPWTHAITADFERFEEEIEQYVRAAELRADAAARDAEAARAATLSRFRALYPEQGA
ncbi:hypothetical protein V8Z80_08285 [Orrella sp. JC864]|uniref:hypothetical protein n=1 Tax=Orrella sp. JC864 TaxID=3120298 RepID=UPI003008078B